MTANTDMEVQPSSFWTGKTFKSFKEFPNADRDRAFDNIIATIAANGYQIVTSNKESGIISASQGVTMGKGKTVPLNAVIRNGKNGGIRIDLSFSTSGGLVVSDDSLVSEFCEIYNSI